METYFAPFIFLDFRTVCFRQTVVRKFAQLYCFIMMKDFNFRLIVLFVSSIFTKKLVHLLCFCQFLMKTMPFDPQLQSHLKSSQQVQSHLKSSLQVKVVLKFLRFQKLLFHFGWPSLLLQPLYLLHKNQLQQR